MAERKNPQLDAQHQAILKRMMQLPENKICADCNGPYPRWASTNLGTFVCMTCSGIHRKLGTHISQVRSITLDTWTASQVAHFQKLGNAKAARYFEACLPQDFKRPHSSDSNRMEAFIRDKYETRRYITVENGGLGGIAARPSATSHLSSHNTLGARPSQHIPQNRPYDDGGVPSSSSSRSYAARFAPHQANNSRTNMPSHRVSSMSTQADAVTRATTLKELVKMGFSTQLSLRAVEASNGDLQRAVDWVLQNSAQSSTRRTTNSAPPPTTKATPVENDLLDFGDDTPAIANQPAGHRAPSRPVAKPTIVPPSHVADFADFGDFESALPAAKPSSLAATTAKVSTPVQKATLSSTLADLYNKPVVSTKAVSPAGARIYAAGGAAMQDMKPLQLSKSSPLSSPKQGPIRPGAQAVKHNLGAQNSVKGSELGLPIFDFQTPKSRTNVNAPTATDTTMPKGVQSVGARPMPPPMQETAILEMKDGPRPPSPPEMAAPPPHPNGVDEANETPDVADKVGDGAQQSEEAAEVTADEDASAKVVEEEDPFAALSMMAMSKATVKKKVVASEQQSSSAPVAGTIEGSNAKTTTTIGIGDIDELLG